MKRKFIIFIDVLIVAFVVCTYYNDGRVITPDENKSVVQEENTETYEIAIIIEKDMRNEVVDEVYEAIALLPVDAIKTFNEKGWKILIVSELDLSEVELDGKDAAEIVGFTDYRTKTIQVKDLGYDGFVKDKVSHELCHYLDYYYGLNSISPKFLDLYSEYKGTYRESQFANIKKNESNSKDIEYASSDSSEMFASALRSYLTDREYLLKEYPSLYNYFMNLTGL